jgi:D-serine deaminase-like pyridoxal phosphate-dependent protein
VALCNYARGSLASHSADVEALAAVPGVTKIRPGNYVFYDAMQVGPGVVSLDRCAPRVLAPVVSQRLIEAAGVVTPCCGPGKDLGLVRRQFYPRCLRMKTREKSPWERRSYSMYPIRE